MRNVEIKAKVEDVDRVENIAKQLSDCLLEVIKQDDIFFHVISQVNLISMQKDNRRLKLRQFEVNVCKELFLFISLILYIFGFRMALVN